MDPIRKIPKKVTKNFVKKVINRHYFHRKTGLESSTFAPFSFDQGIPKQHATTAPSS